MAFFLNLFIYLAFIICLTIYVANNQTGAEQRAIETQNKAFETTRARSFEPYHDIQCSTGEEGIRLPYFTNSSVVNASNPCASVNYSIECPGMNEKADMLTILGSSPNMTCPATTALRNILIKCDDEHDDEGYIAYEVKASKNAACRFFVTNETCNLGAGVTGIIYSTANAVIDTVCSSPYTVPVSDLNIIFN